MFSFDIFFLETLLPLCLGSQVVIASKNQQKDPTEMIGLIDKNQIQYHFSKISIIISITTFEK